MITTLPPNSGGYISSSFVPDEAAKANGSKIFLLSSKARSNLANSHTQYMGHYGGTQKAGKKFKISPILLPISGMDDSMGSEVDVFAATVSNVASEGRVVLVPHAQFCGSTIRVVTQEYASTLPPKIAKGTPFNSSTRSCVTIKDLLPAVTDANEKFVLVLVPNTFGIPAGEIEVVKGTSDDNMAEHFRELGPHAEAWFTIMTMGHPGIHPFSIELQTCITANQLAMKGHYPKYKCLITLTRDYLFLFRAAPAEEDEDDAIYPALAELRSRLREATIRNTPAVQPPLGFDVNMDLDSVADLVQKAPASTTDRMEAKLRLICAGYTPTGGITLYDLRESIKDVLTERKEHQAESLSNQLIATSNSMSLSMDAINRSASWPLAYAETPTVTMFILKAAMATIPITNLQTSASGAQANFSTALLLPHGYDCKHAAAEIASTTTERELQKLLGEDPTKMSRINTKVVVTSILRSERQIVTACANTSVLANTLVEFDVEDDDDANVPFLHATARKLGIVLTSRECLEYSARYNCNSKLHYFAFGLLNRVHCIFFKILRDENSVLASKPRYGNEKIDAISLNAFKLATSCLDKGLEALVEAFSDTKAIEHNEMYTNSVFNADAAKDMIRDAKRKRDEYAEGKSKRQQKREKDAEDKKNRTANVGPLMCSTTKPITLPPAADWPKGEKVLCPAALRDRGKGCIRPGCKKNHDKMKDWSKTMIKFMINFVNGQPDISWNKSVATPSVMDLKLSNDKVLN